MKRTRNMFHDERLLSACYLHVFLRPVASASRFLGLIFVITKKKSRSLLRLFKSHKNLFFIREPYYDVATEAFASWTRFAVPREIKSIVAQRFSARRTKWVELSIPKYAASIEGFRLRRTVEI
ncbi:MAG: hypothetical protein ACLP05_04930 [Candidatus Kryptoniota bacterium]